MLRWASVRPREFDIPAGTAQQVQLTIAMPSDDKLSGEYAGVVFFQTRPERRGGGVAFSARVASKFYITVPNTVQVNGAISKMSSAKGAGRQVYRVLFKNVGNAHEYLRGQVTVQKGGTVVYQVPMPDNMLVERGGVRLIELAGKRSTRARIRRSQPSTTAEKRKRAARSISTSTNPQGEHRERVGL